MSDLKFLEEQDVNPALIEAVRQFRERYPVEESVASRIIRPNIPFYGKDILEMAIAALLEGENLLLTGRRPQEKTSWQRTWPTFSEDPPIMSLSM